MIVLFVNGHQNDGEGRQKFKRYYSYIGKILKQTIYYGNHFEQQVRNKDQLTDYLYDPLQFSHSDRAQEKFKSVGYIFIDGPNNIPPWSLSMKHLYCFIRNCLRQRKKVHFNGFAHLASYYYLSTGFNKDYTIIKGKATQQINEKEDYQYDEETGDLIFHGKKISNSGIVVRKTNRAFTSKSDQALKKGIVLPTKFHYLAFDAKNSHKLLQNVTLPFSVYEKSKVFCTPKSVSKANVTVLVETEGKNPLIFSYENALSTQLLSTQILKVILNWINTVNESHIVKQIEEKFEQFDELGFDNHLQQNKTISYLQSKQVSKPHTNLSSKLVISLKKKFDFEKPSLRCSGPYFSDYERQLLDSKVERKKHLGRSRFIFKGEMSKNQIKNYVQRTPSRPPSAHNFREINKSKWIDKKTFFVT